MIRFSPAPGLSFALLPVLAILLALGVWQVKRLHWKTALLAQIARGDQMPPVPLKNLLDAQAKGQMVAWRRARVTGHIAAQPPQPLYALRHGRQALRLLVPFATADGLAITLDLGFVDYQPKKQWTLPKGWDRPLDLYGVLKPVRKPGPFAIANTAGGLWFSPDPKTLLAAFAQVQKVTAYVLDMEGPRLGPDWPMPAPAHADIPNNHLDYALTWFGLAVAAIGIYLGWHIQAGRLGFTG